MILVFVCHMPYRNGVQQEGVNSPVTVGTETKNAVLNVVAHLKTPFFIYSMPTQFELLTKRQLIQAAAAYSRIIGKSFVVESESFINRKRYILRLFPNE